MSFKKWLRRIKFWPTALPPLVKRNKQTAASTAEPDTDVETSALLHLCHQNTTATKH